MLFAEVQSSPELQTVLVSLGGFVLVTVIKDMIRDKFTNKKEDSKITELSQQTVLLSQIAQGQETANALAKKQNRKFQKRLKRIDDNVRVVIKQTLPADDE